MELLPFDNQGSSSLEEDQLTGFHLIDTLDVKSYWFMWAHQY